MIITAAESAFAFIEIPEGGASISYDPQTFDDLRDWPHRTDGAYLGLIMRSLEDRSKTMAWSTFFSPQRCPPPLDPLGASRLVIEGCNEDRQATISLPTNRGEYFQMDFPPGPAMILLIADSQATYASATINLTNLAEPGTTKKLTPTPVGDYGELWDERSNKTIDPVRTPDEPEAIEITRDFPNIDPTMLFTSNYEHDRARLHPEAYKVYSEYCLENLTNGAWLCFAGASPRPGLGVGYALGILGCNTQPGYDDWLCGGDMRLRYRVEDRGPSESWILYGQTFDWQRAARDRSIPIPSA
ncbi:MAG: hypothetical protein ACLGH3_00900 [Actinomycetota bacterium]